LYWGGGVVGLKYPEDLLMLGCVFVVMYVMLE
jgi:hypothetical protein